MYHKIWTIILNKDTKEIFLSLLKDPILIYNIYLWHDIFQVQRKLNFVFPITLQIRREWNVIITFILLCNHALYAALVQLWPICIYIQKYVFIYIYIYIEEKNIFKCFVILNMIITLFTIFSIQQYTELASD